MKTKLTICLLCAGALMLGGCKTTERNYKQAYDIAIKKKQKEAADPEIQAEGFVRDGAPKKVAAGNEQIYVLVKRMEALKPVVTPLKDWNVAVAAYKMAGNAQGQSEGLRDEGYKEARVVLSSDIYYVIAAGFDSKDEAASFIRDYKKRHPDVSYIGLPEGPTVLVPTGSGVKL